MFENFTSDDLKRLRDEEKRQKKRFSIYIDEEDYHKIEETSSANGITKNKVINDFLKTCLKIVGEVGDYIREKDLDTLLQLVDMKTTKQNVYKLHSLLSDLHLIKTIKDTIGEGGTENV
jgi:hypothetical protein